MRIKFTLFIFLVSSLTIFETYAQNKNYARQIIERLASKDFSGRGYINNGDLKAAMYIASEFQKLKTSPINKSFLLPFDISINTFPEPLTLKVDNKRLKAGKDFFVGGGSPTIDGDFEIVYMDTTLLKKSLKENINYPNKVIVLPGKNIRNKKTYTLNAAGYIFTSEKKIYWKLSDAVELKPYFYFYAIDSLVKNGKIASISIKNEFHKNYKTSNVVAQITGKKYPDSIFVFTAHYDHLGMMGDVIFPGANDNASGTAMLLDMARHYSREENQPDYSMIFIAFAAEESGLWGSKNLAQNPPFPLDRIKFLFNLDMVGSGSEGLGMVNAKIEPRADSLLRAINEKHKFFSDIKSRGPSCNSDHCPFAQKGVPSIFIFTRGKEYMHYHTPDDNGPVPLTKWNELFQMLDIFINTY